MSAAPRSFERAAGNVGDGRREPSEEPVVDRHEQNRREQQDLGGDEHREAPRPAAQPAHHRQRDDGARQREREPEPGQRGERDRGARDPADAWQVAQAQREDRREREQRARGELRRDRGAVGQRRRREPARERRGARPRLRHDPPRERPAEREGERRDRRQEQLHRERPAERVRRRDEQRKPDAVRLVGLPVRQPPVALEHVRVPVAIRARRVLVAQVDVVVGDDRLGRQQVVRLVAAELRSPERVQPDRRGIGREQDEPDGGGTAHALHDRAYRRSSPPTSRGVFARESQAHPLTHPWRGRCAATRLGSRRGSPAGCPSPSAIRRSHSSRHRPGREPGRRRGRAPG